LILRLITPRVLLFMVSVSAGFAGLVQAQGDESAPGFRTSVDVVNVAVTAQRGSQFVTDLTRDDFEVYEDGVRQEIQYFALEQGDDAQPLSMVLLIDTSGSVKEKLLLEQQAAEIFLEETLRPQKDLAAVIQFDSDINLVQDFTNTIPLLVNSIGSIRAGGATKLYDAIWLSATDMLSQQIGRRLIVVLSDGDDTQSALTDDEAIQAAQRADVVIFGIGVKTGPSNFGKLKEFARETGGAFFDSKARLDELRSAFARINRSIKSQYSIGYVSNNPARDGQFREIEVKAKKSGLKLNYRKGYYAPDSAS